MDMLRHSVSAHIRIFYTRLVVNFKYRDMDYPPTMLLQNVKSIRNNITGSVGTRTSSELMKRLCHNYRYLLSILITIYIRKITIRQRHRLLQ